MPGRRASAGSIVDGNREYGENMQATLKKSDSLIADQLLKRLADIGARARQVQSELAKLAAESQAARAALQSFGARLAESYGLPEGTYDYKVVGDGGLAISCEEAK